jgi:hypothetical protein
MAMAAIPEASPLAAVRAWADSMAAGSADSMVADLVEEGSMVEAAGTTKNNPRAIFRWVSDIEKRSGYAPSEPST